MLYKFIQLQIIAKWSNGIVNVWALPSSLELISNHFVLSTEVANKIWAPP